MSGWRIFTTDARLCCICGIRINFHMPTTHNTTDEQGVLIMSAETHILTAAPRIVTEIEGCECFQINDTCIWNVREHNFVFHPHCWTWLERVYGEVAMERKDLVLGALGKWWVGNGEGKARTWRALFSDVTIQRQDPLHVAPLRGLVKRVKSGNKEARVTRRTTRSRSVQNSIVRANLPLDVVLLILDRLSLREVYFATVAFEWRLPAVYWKARFPCQLVFELDELDLDALDDQDWKYLCGEYICMQKPPGFRNRQRIFRILEQTREYFLTAMEEGKERKRTADEMLSAG